MGTKKNPSEEFNCYAHAADDEPIFVLRAKDPYAHLLVDKWADMKSSEGSMDEKQIRKIAEARKCAADMREWRAHLQTMLHGTVSTRSRTPREGAGAVEEGRHVRSNES